jgi:NADPH:quinone reductase-like Zn-dependent oxidoreductase
MRAAVVRTFGGPEVVEIVDADVLVPGPRQVRIKVAAAALNPADAHKRSGNFGDAGVLGADVAGTVDAAGADTSWTAGDEVVALGNGTHAEYVVVEADWVAPAPSSADAVHASTLPLNALTAARALDLLALREGQSLLVTGAAGAVGGYAVQLAARQGVSVTALAREQDEQLVQSLGAAHVADVTGGADFDAVLDAAFLGEPALARVRDAGVYVGVIRGAAPFIGEHGRGLGGGRRRRRWRLGSISDGVMRIALAGSSPTAKSGFPDNARPVVNVSTIANAVPVAQRLVQSRGRHAVW